MKCLKCKSETALYDSGFCHKCNIAFETWYKELVSLCIKNAELPQFLTEMRNFWIRGG